MCSREKPEYLSYRTYKLKSSFISFQGKCILVMYTMSYIQIQIQMIYIYIYIYLYVWIYVCVCMCVYIYIYISSQPPKRGDGELRERDRENNTCTLSTSTCLDKYICQYKQVGLIGLKKNCNLPNRESRVGMTAPQSSHQVSEFLLPFAARSWLLILK